ncbi:MAG: hypothetical protein AUJ75_03395 [Candidatus Omnitrophica bacterium CG1_02_49_10]|nr:MAG: hypothetical protein AUJ75_03395 [Candidatus Omnitrophica bacterium CG1_02_49_10]
MPRLINCAKIFFDNFGTFAGINSAMQLMFTSFHKLRPHLDAVDEKGLINNYVKSQYTNHKLQTIPKLQNIRNLLTFYKVYFGFLSFGIVICL